RGTHRRPVSGRRRPPTSPPWPAAPPAPRRPVRARAPPRPPRASSWHEPSTAVNPPGTDSPRRCGWPNARSTTRTSWTIAKVLAGEVCCAGEAEESVAGDADRDHAEQERPERLLEQRPEGLVEAAGLLRVVGDGGVQEQHADQADGDALGAVADLA